MFLCGPKDVSKRKNELIMYFFTSSISASCGHFAAMFGLRSS